MMRRPPKLDPRKRLVGFGPAGWIAAVGLLALLQAVVRGVDVRYHVLYWIDRLLGIDAVFWVVAHAMPPHLFALSEGRFGLVAMLYWLIALQIYPERKSWMWAVLLIVWGLLAPMLPWEIIIAVGRGNPGFWGSPAQTWTMFGAAIGAELVAAAILVAMTRSRRVLGAAVVGLAIASATAAVRAGYAAPSIFHQAAWVDPWLWHALMGGAALWWAISARARAVGPGQCEACGYDRGGLKPRTPCPECGAAPPEAPTGGE